MPSPTKLSYVQAVILAGGFGTRLHSVSPDRQKVISEIRDRPFLLYLLEQLSVADVQSAILCTGHLGEQVESEIGSSYGDIEIIYSREKTPLGTAGAVRNTLPLLSSPDALIMNGDSYYDIELSLFIEWCTARNSLSAIALTEVSDTKRYGQVHVDDNGCVTRFEEKNETGGPGWINAGIYFINRSILATIPDESPVSMENRMFPALIGKGLNGYKTTGKFIDIGTPESYKEAELFFKAKTIS
ncbi:nucleotidyltransferase family protein [Candidatus Latescibacterota bacterium]